MNRRDALSLAAAAVVAPTELLPPQEVVTQQVTWRAPESLTVQYISIYNAITGECLYSGPVDEFCAKYHVVL